MGRILFLHYGEITVVVQVDAWNIVVVVDAESFKFQSLVHLVWEGGEEDRRERGG